jgi:hypothetical protein
MLITVKSREVQRGLLAEMGHRKTEARSHFLAAAHLELVLAGDYELADQLDLARRSRISAASCFWRADELDLAREFFADLIRETPDQAHEIQQIIADLEATDHGPRTTDHGQLTTDH